MEPKGSQKESHQAVAMLPPESRGSGVREWLGPTAPTSIRSSSPGTGDPLCPKHSQEIGAPVEPRGELPRASLSFPREAQRALNRANQTSALVSDFPESRP